MRELIYRIKKYFHPWEYGQLNNRFARRHKRKRNVQFILWKAGEQGHQKDYWHNFDPSWWSSFRLVKELHYNG